MKTKTYKTIDKTGWPEGPWMEEVDKMQWTDKATCHIPEPGESDHVWWFGFDCGHPQDRSPNMRFGLVMGRYRTVDYVRNECRFLAKQLKALT